MFEAFRELFRGQSEERPSKRDIAIRARVDEMNNPLCRDALQHSQEELERIQRGIESRVYDPNDPLIVEATIVNNILKEVSTGVILKHLNKNHPELLSPDSDTQE